MNTIDSISLVKRVACVLAILMSGITVADSPWPMFHHDTQYTGRSAFTGPQSLNNPANQVQILVEGEGDNDYFGTPVIGSDGTLYLAARITKSGNTKEGLYAFGPDGISKWVNEISGLSGMPALCELNNTVYILSQGVGISAINTANGTLRWSKGFNSLHGPQNPIITQDGILYFVAGCTLPDGNSNSCLIAIDQTGNELWAYAVEEDKTYYDFELPDEPPGSGSNWSSVTNPAIDETGTVYFGYNNTLVALNPDGTKKWQRAFNGGIRTHSIASNRIIYIVVKNEFYDPSSGFSYDGFHAVNLDNPLEERWVPPKSDAWFNTGIPVISASENVYILHNYQDFWSNAYRFHIYGFDSQGNGWSSDAYAGADVQLIVDTTGTLYARFDNTVGAFDEQLQLKWSCYLGDQRSGTLSLDQDGTLYVGGQKKLFAIKPFTDQDTGYAIIVAGEGGMGPVGYSIHKRMIDHAANNAYKALHNLGFTDSSIIYLNNWSQEIDGEDVVDHSASSVDFAQSINEIGNITEGNTTPVLIYLVGHGDKEVFFFFPPEEDTGTGGDYLLSSELRDMLEILYPNQVTAIIVSCYSGSFITLDYFTDSVSVKDRERIIITATHDNTSRKWVGCVRSSDCFFGDLMQGMSVGEAFTRRIWPGDKNHLWLDDNGDAVGHPPDNLADDGLFAVSTKVGYPGADNLALTPWIYALKHSLGELRVYDSQNRVTGMVAGEKKEDIPGSLYDTENDFVVIFSPSDLYSYKVFGTTDGIYGLDVGLVEGGEVREFTVNDIPLPSSTVHQYIIDWELLSQSEEGVNLSIDSDGDGNPERTITSDSNLVSYEVAIEPAGYEIVDQNRVSRTEFEYTLRLRVVNLGLCDLKNITMQLTSVPANTVVLDDTVSFSEVAPGQTVSSDATFKIRTDRSIEGLESQIVWKVVSCTEPAKADFNYDWQVDLLDLVQFGQAWLLDGDDMAEDLYEDNIVDFRDLAVFAGSWLAQ